MDPEAVLRQCLSAPAVTDLVGTRLYASVCPPTVWFPMVTYELFSGTPERALRTDAGVDDVRWMVSSWGRTLASAKAVGDAVRAALEGQRSPVAQPEWSFSLVQHVARYDEGWQLYEVQQQYAMQHQTVTA